MDARKTWLWTAMVTPFTADGSAVDYASFGKILKMQEAAGNGILILGSTGESLSLSEEEKQEIVRYTFSLGLKVPVMVGTPNANMAQTLAWLDFCRGKGAHAYLAATPLYTKPAAQGQIGWFRKLFDAADAQVMLYNVPGRTGAALNPAVLSDLRAHKNFWAVKESSGGLDAYASFADAAPDAALYCGDDNMLASATPLGACGLVSVVGNAWPEACRAYVEACRAGRYRGQIWWNASKAMFTTTSPVPVKALMHDLGMIASGAVRLPLSRNDLASLDQVRAAHQAVAQWHGALASESVAA
ncbi:MAG: 4-hydroxy-tetrahydrodipicolinate synthase [Alphaproteobacteria bacterium]|nr:4-hydroxy-tetrahydrodipicolinate synthase [Alphaproteobacteria bacterium]